MLRPWAMIYMLTGRNELTKHKTPKQTKTKYANGERCNEDCLFLSFEGLTWSVKNHSISQNVTIEETHIIGTHAMKVAVSNQIPDLNSSIYKPN